VLSRSTLFLVLAPVIGGILRIVVELRHRVIRGWWLMALSGLISALLYASLPWSGLWVPRHADRD
jgi:uncharacterized membrane protein HdeD (DUF308 family)